MISPNGAARSALALLTMAGLALCFGSSPVVAGQAPPGRSAPIDYTYYPGEVDINLPLAEFVPARLAPACDSLRKGDVEAARAAFEAELKRHPGDLACRIGYLQARRGHLQPLLAPYERDVANAPEASDYFKLGLLQYYLRGTRSNDISDGGMVWKQGMAEQAKANLEKAYLATHDPLIGFTLNLAYVQCGGRYLSGSPGSRRDRSAPPRRLAVLDDIMARTAGAEAYAAFERDRKAGYPTPTPPAAPALTRHNLVVVQYVVRKYRSRASARAGIPERTTVGGRTVTRWRWTDLSPEAERAFQYLTKWRDELGAAIHKAPE